MLEVPELASGNPQLQKALNKIVQAEERGLKKFDDKKSVEDNKLKLIREFKTKATEARDAVTPFKTPKDFRELSGTSSSPDVLNVTSVDKNVAQLGSYDIEVIQMANSNSVSTYGFPDKDKTQVGVGYVSFDTKDGGSKEVYIGSDNNTLEGVANAINTANIGVKALVVNDGSDADEPWRLVISSDKTGWKNDIVWPDFNLLDGDVDFDIDHTREAKSAIIKINGEPIMVDENKVKSLLPGVAFDLKKAQPGQVIKMEIRPDYDKIQEKAKAMVDKLNGVLSFIQNQNQLGEKSSKDPTKALGGDVLLHSIESRLRSALQTTVGSLSDTQIRALGDMGIAFTRTGTLSYDPKQFQAKLEANYDDVVNFFTGGTGSTLAGLGTQLTSIMDGITRRGDGVVTIREDGLTKKISGLEKEKDQANERAQQRIERARAQFGRAEAAIQEMQNFNGGGGGIASLLPRG